MGQLSWQAATTEASALERSSHTTVKSPCATTKTQCSQININNFFKNHRIFFEKVNDWYIDFWKLLAIRKYVPLMKTNLQDTFFPEQWIAWETKVLLKTISHWFANKTSRDADGERCHGWHQVGLRYVKLFKNFTFSRVKSLVWIWVLSILFLFFHLFHRRRESQSQEDLRNQLQNTVHELEAAKCLKDDMLKDSSTQIEQLRKMMLSHEGVLQEIRSVLVDFEEASGKKVFEHDNMSTIHSRNMASAISKILRELDTEISYLKGRIFPVSGENTMSILY